MIYVIQKEIRGFKYYANFPQAPLHFRYPKWEGLISNATGFIFKGKAESIINKIDDDSLDPLTVTVYEHNTTLPLKLVIE